MDNGIWLEIRQNERDKRTFCSACMCYGLTWTFCMDEDVCLLLCNEGSFFCFRNVTMAVHIGLRSRDSRDNTWSLFAIDNSRSLERCFVAVDVICCH